MANHIRTVFFDQSAFLTTGELYPEEICKDPWIAYHGTSDVPKDDSRPVDLDWLRSELDALAPVRQVCATAYEEHQFGVVYAVRFDESDLEHLNLHRSMGIKAFRRIGPEKIVAKVSIPVDATGPFVMPKEIRERHLATLLDPHCLLGNLALKARAQLSMPDRPFDV